MNTVALQLHVGKVVQYFICMLIWHVLQQLQCGSTPHLRLAHVIPLPLLRVVLRSSIGTLLTIPLLAIALPARILAAIIGLCILLPDSVPPAACLALPSLQLVTGAACCLLLIPAMLASGLALLLMRLPLLRIILLRV